MATASLTPFTLRTDPAALDELRARLRATRWVDAPPGSGWELGVDTEWLRQLVEYWADGFDWPAVEARLNELPHFRAALGNGDPLGVHFVHVRAPRIQGAPAPLPLVLSHGWPDSFWRYLKVIPLLTDPGAHGGDPADAFDVVVPDVPGFGYSARPAHPLDSRQVADLWAELMTLLGYERFAAAGGDIGSHVSRYLALDHPSRVVAVHRTDAGLPPAALDPTVLSDEERRWVSEAMAWGAAEGAYAAVHRTKPQTTGVALTDSPAGLAAWIVEKLHAWSDLRPGGSLDGVYTRDEILTNLTIYWLTGTIASSMRMYRANAALPPEQLLRRVEVPSGFSLFAGDIVRPPRAWLERSANTVWVTEPSRGGHFAAFEQPELYASELREFFRPFR
ncbi:epoxide hydrolase [Herbiconiux moechotypicola]|uniref:Epoxide hydrolase n=1 Tax=Herbiconiux moechotypicola TaxID=637393 RepID=A0ABP5Q2Q5_9MICO|nr:epoxide hydrolase family protein [Herbiconiux moechotypicola]MCS5728197.1 epoxide hydrolase [Herbiconiux moechotypicola]